MGDERYCQFAVRGALHLSEGRLQRTMWVDSLKRIYPGRCVIFHRDAKTAAKTDPAVLRDGLCALRKAPSIVAERYLNSAQLAGIFKGSPFGR